jgi:hypothetical protein
MGTPKKRTVPPEREETEVKKPQEPVQERRPPPPDPDELEAPGDGFPENLSPANRLGPSH